MRIKNQELFEIFKPVQNRLSQVSIEDAFYVIWAYINHFQFKQPFPSAIEVHPAVINASVTNRPIYEWELALIAREIIVAGQIQPSSASQSFTSWDFFLAITNDVKIFENSAWNLSGEGKNILREIRRIAHRQFPWQRAVSQIQLLRNYLIFNSPRLSEIVQNNLGLTVQQWYTVGLALVGKTLSYESFDVDIEVEIYGVTQREFDIVFSKISSTLDDLKIIIQRDIHFDEQYLYSFNPLEYYPLVKIGGSYYCPIINFLIRRLTSGLFFDLIGDKNFGHPFGLAFQDYLEKVARASLDLEKTEVLSEQKYTVGKNEEDSVDLILLQNNHALFVEAKAKRLQARSKSQLISDEAMDKDLEILAKDVVQVYSTVFDYKQGRYSHIEHKEGVKIFPVIITLEEWFLMGEDLRSLKKKVKRILEERKMPVTFVEEMPFVVSSSEGFEILVQVINKHSIEELMAKWLTPEKDGHNFGQFLMTEYGKDEYKTVPELFPNEMKQMFPPDTIPLL